MPEAAGLLVGRDSLAVPCPSRAESVAIGAGLGHIGETGTEGWAWGAGGLLTLLLWSGRAVCVREASLQKPGRRLLSSEVK